MKSPSVPFGAKCVLFSGDFRQILPVVPRVSQGMIVFMCFQSSPLYPCMSFLSLSENVRLQSIRDDEDPDPAVFEYPNFLLKVGEGKLKQTEDSFIEVPPSVNIVESLTNQYLELWELIYTIHAFLMVYCMLLFRGRQTREMSSFLQLMVPTEPRMLYFRNYLVCAKLFLEFAIQLYRNI